MSQKAKNFAARLSAVQALYQASQNQQPLDLLLNEYVSMRGSVEMEGEEPLRMDRVLFEKIVQGVFEGGKELQESVAENYSKKNKKIEPLLKSILVCGFYEIKAHQEVDAPIIINDYLNITHSFYGESEVSLVNALLDNVKKSFRAN